MFIKVCLLAAVIPFFPSAADADCRPQAPCYSGESVVNAASGFPGALGPNTLATIYGTGLAFDEKAISPSDINADQLPIVLPGTGVTVSVGGYPAHIYYVSPGQITLLIPSNLRPTTVTLQVVRQGTAGPSVQVKLLEEAPALFQSGQQEVVASHEDFSLVTPLSPARPGGWLILWATGLGPVTPPAVYGMIPEAAARIDRIADFRVLLDGAAVSSDRIQYAGVAPGCAGLYQINVKLPEVVSTNPEVRIAVGSQISPAGLHVYVQPASDLPRS